jgi:hypothetical protein
LASEPEGFAVAHKPREQPDQDLVRLYLGEAGKHALLTKDDEVHLAQAIEAGRAARDRLSASADHGALSTTEERELRHQAQVGEEAAEAWAFVLCGSASAESSRSGFCEVQRRPALVSGERQRSPAEPPAHHTVATVTTSIMQK